MGAWMKFEEKAQRAKTQHRDARCDIDLASAYELFGFFDAFAFGSLFCAFLCERAHR